MNEISATELKQKMDAGEDFQLIDVREENEWEICRVEGAKLVPLSQISERAAEIDPTKETVVMCKGGVRSAKVIQFLESSGFPSKLINLRGGITAWSNEVDPSVVKY